MNPLDEDGVPHDDQAAFRIVLGGLQVFALTGGRNEYYSYSPDDNRLSRTLMSTESTEERYRYIPNSDLVAQAGKYAFRYDEKENLIERWNREDEDSEYYTYWYDLLNRLIIVTGPDEETGENVTGECRLYRTKSSFVGFSWLTFSRLLMFVLQEENVATVTLRSRQHPFRVFPESCHPAMRFFHRLNLFFAI